MLEFLSLWFWYIGAFALGVLAMWVFVTFVIKPRTADEAIDEAIQKKERSKL